MDLLEPNIDLSQVPQPEKFDFEAWKAQDLSSLPPPTVPPISTATPQPLTITGGAGGVLPSTQTQVPPPSEGYNSLLNTLNPPSQPAFQDYKAPATAPISTATPQPEKPVHHDAVGREIEGERKFAIPSGETQDSLQSQEMTQPQFIEDTQTQSQYSSQKTLYDKKDVNEFDSAISNVKRAQDGISSIMKSLDNDPEIKKQIGKVAATSMSLEDMLDPNSENFKNFTETVSKAKAEMDKAEADLAEFQKEAKVDPDKYMREMPSTKKSMLAIAALLEGTGAIMAAQGGMMLPTGVISKQLQDGINRDIALQKDELASKEKGLATDANRYAKNLALLKDERAAELKTKADMLTASKMTLDNLRSKYQDQLNSAEADKIAAGLDMELAKTKLEMNKKLVSNSTQTITKKTPLSTVDVKKQAEAQKALNELQETEVPLFGKHKVEAYSKDEAKGLREDLAAYEGIMGMLETMKQLESEEGYAMYGTDAAALGNALSADFLLLKKNLEKLGVLSESDKGIIEDLLANPTSISLKGARAKIENQILQATNKITSNLNAKTKVGENRFLEKDLYGLVVPSAKKRATETLNKVLDYNKGNATALTNQPKQPSAPKGKTSIEDRVWGMGVGR